MFTKSRHVPGVSYAGLIHPGLIGCLPDHKMLEAWNTREQELIDSNPGVTGLANPPFAGTAHMGKLTGEARTSRCHCSSHRAPTRTRRQLRHQRPVARLQVYFLCMWMARACR